MKYLKLFEDSLSHWSLLLKDLPYERDNDILELTYEFSDMDMDIIIEHLLMKSGWASLGNISDYLNEDTKLYKVYDLVISSKKYPGDDPDKIIEIKENQITLFKRLKDNGFTIFINEFRTSNSNTNWLLIHMYHKDDEVDKSLFLTEDNIKHMADEPARRNTVFEVTHWMPLPNKP